ncbi:MAG: M48 family metallopeptidase [Bacteroidales bacterium]|jgi:hypothetical protein|nr:M48 family metallopeptidase [Bacteroidales bacterium]
MKKRTVSIASEEVEIDIVRSSRRTVALYVKPGGTLMIRAPWYIPLYSLMQFVREKTGWIIRQREKMKDIRPAAEINPVEDGSHIPFLGRNLKLKVSPSARSRVEFVGDELHLMLPVPVPGKIAASVDAWYLSEAKKFFLARTSELVAKHQSLLPAPESIGARKMKRRWGTCRTNGTIWLNRELIKKDPELIDYVIIHELCHLVHHNHSRQYYQLLESIIPDYKQLRSRLSSIA